MIGQMRKRFSHASDFFFSFPSSEFTIDNDVTREYQEFLSSLRYRYSYNYLSVVGFKAINNQPLFYSRRIFLSINDEIIEKTRTKRLLEEFDAYYLSVVLAQ